MHCFQNPLKIMHFLKEIYSIFICPFCLIQDFLLLPISDNSPFTVQFRGKTSRKLRIVREFYFAILESTLI